jgi:hypothetical protein
MTALEIPRWGLWMMFLASLVGSVLLAVQLFPALRRS